MPQVKRAVASSNEPQFNEVMEDPIIKLLMKKDGVKQEMLLPLIKSIFEVGEVRDREWRPQS